MTTFRWYLLGLAVLFAGYVAVEYYRPKPLDWTPTYSSKDKIPYGTYVLYDVLPEVLGTASVQPVRIPIYNQLGDTTGQLANYLFVQRSFASSPAETRKLLRYVARGNNVFIAADDFGESLQDTLGFRTELALQPSLPRPTRTAQPDSVTLRLTNAPLAATAGSRFRFPAAAAAYRLELDSTARATALATDARGGVVLARIGHGRGHFYLSSVPLAFTNYFVLHPRTSNFAFAALSYLPARPAWWDEYQKQGRTGEQSLVRVLLSHEALRVAYYLTCLGVLLFVLFEAKRRQRIIPVLVPLPNTTLLFTRTVASLYRQSGNHALIAEKKIGLFLEYLRTRFQEASLDLNDEELRERLAQKAGVPRPRVDSLVRIINMTRTAPRVTDQDLLALNQALSTFRWEAS